MIGFLRLRAKRTGVRQHQPFSNLLFISQIIFVGLQIIFVIVMANLMVRISLVVGGHYAHRSFIAPEPIKYVPFFGHGQQIGVASYVVTAILFFILFSGIVIEMGVLFIPRRPARIRAGIIGSGLAQMTGLLLGVVWAVLFSSDHQHFFLITGTWTLVGLNGCSMVIICGYWWLNRRLGRLNSQNRPKIIPAVFIPRLAGKPFFEPALMDSFNFQKRLLYVRSCKNRTIFSLDRYWLVIIKIYFPQILLSLMWVGYELVSRVLIIHFAAPHYHHHSPAEIIASLNLAMRYGNSVFGLLFVIISFVTAPLQVLFARAVAQQNRQAAERAVSFAVFLSLILILIFLPIGMGSVNFLIKTQDSVVNDFTLRMARRLILLTIGLLPIFFIFYIFFDLLTCEGRFRLFVLCSLLQIGFQIFFIWVLAAFSNLKILAAPVGDMISFGLMAVILLSIIGRDPTSWIKVRWRWIRPYPQKTVTFFKIGFATLIKIMTMILAQIYYVRLTRFAPVATGDIRSGVNVVVQFVATFGVFTFFVRSFFIGVSTANLQVLSYCYSRRLWYRMRKMTEKVLILNITWWLLCNVLAWTIGTRFLHLLNPDLPVSDPKIRLFLGLTIAGIINRALISVLTDVLQAAGRKNTVIAIYIVNLFLGVIFLLNGLWSITWATFSLTHSQFILFLYSLSRLVVAVVTIAVCWYHFQPLWRVMMAAKSTDDQNYNREIKHFRTLLVKHYNNNTRTMARKWSG